MKRHPSSELVSPDCLGRCRQKASFWAACTWCSWQGVPVTVESILLPKPNSSAKGGTRP